MSMTNITESPDQGSAPEGWRPQHETAPSVMRADEPVFARYVGMAGLMFFTLGAAAWLLGYTPLGTRIRPELGKFFISGGLLGRPLHAARAPLRHHPRPRPGGRGAPQLTAEISTFRQTALGHATTASRVQMALDDRTVDTGGEFVRGVWGRGFPCPACPILPTFRLFGG